MDYDPSSSFDIGECVLAFALADEVVSVLQTHGKDFVKALRLVDVAVEGVGNDVLRIAYCLHSEVIGLSVGAKKVLGE